MAPHRSWAMAGRFPKSASDIFQEPSILQLVPPFGGYGVHTIKRTRNGSGNTGNAVRITVNRSIYVTSIYQYGLVQIRIYTQPLESTSKSLLLQCVVSVMERNRPGVTFINPWLPDLIPPRT
jgi:hypothetical protein